MITDEPDERRGFLKCMAWAGTGGGVDLEGIAVRPVRLVLLLLVGPREGENDTLEFASVDDAVAYGRQLYGEPQFQLEGIEDGAGKSLVSYDYLNDLCCVPCPMPQRRLCCAPCPVPQRRYG